MSPLSSSMSSPRVSPVHYGLDRVLKIAVPTDQHCGVVVAQMGLVKHVHGELDVCPLLGTSPRPDHSPSAEHVEIRDPFHTLKECFVPPVLIGVIFLFQMDIVVPHVSQTAVTNQEVDEPLEVYVCAWNRTP